ncbi:MAG: amidohydrolase family protein, partial [Actinomycetota bacterium]
AAAEIRRLGGHPQMVQIGMPTGDRRLGHRFYDPIYEAAQEVGLPIGWHPGSETAGINDHMTAMSAPTSYIENNASIIQVSQAQLISVLTEGTFEKFPELKVVLIEGGVTWIPSVVWRLHTGWLALRDEVPWMKQAPMDYIKKHVRFTTQPLDEPPGDRQKLIDLLGTFDAQDILLYSSDYPHWNFDNPLAVFAGFPEDWKRKIFFENSRDFYDRIPAALLT